MSDNDLKPALFESARQVLEETVFVLAEEQEEETTWESTMIEASIPFTGPMSGTIALATTLEFGAELAAGLLGVEPEELPQDEGGDESLAELLNILMGVVAQEWFGNKDCDFGIPQVKRLSPAEHAEARGKATITLALVTDEFEQLDLAVYLKS